MYQPASIPVTDSTDLRNALARLPRQEQLLIEEQVTRLTDGRQIPNFGEVGALEVLAALGRFLNSRPRPNGRHP